MNKMAKFKKYYLYCLIGSLISAALVAIASILIGSFTDTTGRVLGTLALVVVHSLVSLTIVKDENNKINKLAYFSDTLFVLLVASLITSLFAVWQLISESLTGQLYALFFIVGFSVLHGNSLYLIMGKNKMLTRVLSANLFAITAVAIMFVPVILTSGGDGLDDFYYRLLGSVGVVDVTLTVIAVILYKLHLQRNPGEINELVFNTKSGGILKILGFIFIAFFGIQILFSLLLFAMSFTN